MKTYYYYIIWKYTKKEHFFPIYWKKIELKAVILETPINQSKSLF